MDFLGFTSCFMSLLVEILWTHCGLEFQIWIWQAMLISKYTSRAAIECDNTYWEQFA